MDPYLLSTVIFDEIRTGKYDTFRQHIQAKCFTALKIDKIKITLADVPHLLTALQDTDFTELTCRYTHLGDQGSVLLVQGLSHQIQRLSLPYNGITAHACQQIGEQLRHKQVLRLDLSFNAVGNAGCQILAEHLSGSSVSFLDLRSNQINNQQMNTFFTLLQKANIRGVDLRFNEIENEGFKQIQHNLGQKIIACHLAGNPINEENLHPFEKTLAARRIFETSMALYSLKSLPVELIFKIVGFVYPQPLQKKLFLKAWETFKKVKPAEAPSELFSSLSLTPKK